MRRAEGADAAVPRMMGIFEVLADDGEKYHARTLTVRCTRCGTVAERTYASVQTFRSKACQHCPRRLAKQAIVELIRAHGPQTTTTIERGLPPEHTRKRCNLVKILDELVKEGEIVRYHPLGWSRTWMFELTHLPSPSARSTTGAVGAASASSPPNAEATASPCLEGGPSRSTA